MKYNFDEVIDRSNTNCVKWDRMDKDILPMWVADMDFATAQPIIDAIQKKAAAGVFGYTYKPEAYYEAVLYWWNKHYSFKLSKEWVVYFPGIVPALSMLFRTLLKSGDKVIIQSPVYHPFYHVINNNGFQVVENPLIFNGESYDIDFDDLEKKASDPNVKIMLLCSPHNPVGRVWTREELTRIGNICIKNNLLVIADEIHCDLVYDGYTHVPFASINESFLMNSITCTAPSKTFNIAGLQISNLIVPDGELRKKITDEMAVMHIEEPNVFGVEALIAAYTEGDEWLKQLLEYLQYNIEYVCSFIDKGIPSLKVIRPQGTYLVWIDCRALNMNSSQLNTFLLQNAKVQINQGKMFGDNGDGFIRLNVACPKTLLIEGLNRIKKAVDTYMKR